MTDFASLLSQGTAHAWLFIPSAILLGALHGLEPGHSKTMMAAFIVAVRGTPAQAILLGLCATLSHTILVWIIALGGLYVGREWDMEANEVYFQLASGVAIIVIAIWMLISIWRSQSHNHKPLAHNPLKPLAHRSLKPTVKDATTSQVLSIKAKSSHSTSAILDPHAQAHADQIQRQFAGGSATHRQIIFFGLTGGLIPCPASITVLLLCLQLKEFALGASLVLCFSIGLALTMVGSGLVAAWGLRHINRWRNPKIENLINKAPYLSGALVLCVGGFVCFSALSELWAR